MRILVLSNFYPPNHIGGYELGCQDVVLELKKRGHDVRVLTSSYGVERPETSDSVYRWLKISFGVGKSTSLRRFIRLCRNEIASRRVGARVLDEFQPELVYVWNARHISISIVSEAQRRGCRICYFVSDYWLAEWTPDSWYSEQYTPSPTLSKRFVWQAVNLVVAAIGLRSADKLDLKHVQFASKFLKESALRSGKPVTDAEVIHWGVNLKQFVCKDRSSAARRLLYVGQLIKNKGVHNAIKALKIVIERSGNKEITLTIVGGPDYDGSLHQLVTSLDLESNVYWTGSVPRAHLPKIHQDHDTLVFPSIWDEPFSLTLLEGMASGLAVVSTATGGTPEILVDEVNALIFPPDDPEACANQIIRLQHNPELHERIRLDARRTVEKQYNFVNMMNRIEMSLSEAKPSRLRR